MTSPAFEERWLTGPSGTRFYTRTYKADKPKALLVFVHGYAEHVGRYGHAHPKYPQKDITVFTYDARGFGKTALDLENKSDTSSYGKTSWEEQFEDIEWAIRHARKEIPGIPTFLMGHSMVSIPHVRMLFFPPRDLVWVFQGGGNVLGFVTRTAGPPSPDAVELLSGVIASSPLLNLASQSYFLYIERFLGRIVRLFLPNLPVPTPIAEEVGGTLACYPNLFH
jgi:acylglycerol lipase